MLCESHSTTTTTTTMEESFELCVSHLHTQRFVRHQQIFIMAVYSYRFTVKLLPPWKCARRAHNAMPWMMGALYLSSSPSFTEKPVSMAKIHKMAGDEGVAGGKWGVCVNLRTAITTNTFKMTIRSIWWDHITDTMRNMDLKFSSQNL